MNGFQRGGGDLPGPARMSFPENIDPDHIRFKNNKRSKGRIYSSSEGVRISHAIVYEEYEGTVEFNTDVDESSLILNDDDSGLHAIYTFDYSRKKWSIKMMGAVDNE